MLLCDSRCAAFCITFSVVYYVVYTIDNRGRGIGNVYKNSNDVWDEARHARDTPPQDILTMHKRYCSVADQQKARPIGQVYVLHTAIDFVDYIAYVCLLTPIEFGISRLF